MNSSKWYPGCVKLRTKSPYDGGFTAINQHWGRYVWGTRLFLGLSVRGPVVRCPRSLGRGVTSISRRRRASLGGCHGIPRNSPFETTSGWWFGCHFLFSHYIGKNHPNWLSYFQRGGPTTNQTFSREFPHTWDHFAGVMLRDRDGYGLPKLLSDLVNGAVRSVSTFPNEWGAMNRAMNRVLGNHLIDNSW